MWRHESGLFQRRVFPFRWECPRLKGGTVHSMRLCLRLWRGIPYWIFNMVGRWAQRDVHRRLTQLSSLLSDSEEICQGAKTHRSHRHWCWQKQHRLLLREKSFLIILIHVLFCIFSFGKRSAGSLRRGCECIVLEPSEMIVVSPTF